MKLFTKWFRFPQAILPALLILCAAFLGAQTTAPFAVGLSAQGVIMTVDVPGIVSTTSAYNANKIAGYKLAVTNWLASLTQATAALPAGPPPSPITITQVDQTQLANILVAWNNTLARGVPGSYYNVNLAPAFSQVPYPPDPRIASAEAPPAALPQPSDPVGIQINGNVYAVPAGDTTAVGTIVTDSRGLFVKEQQGEDLFGAPILVYVKIA